MQMDEMARVRYSGGDEEEQYFWDLAGGRYDPLFWVRTEKITLWSIDDMVAHAEKNGLQVAWKLSKANTDSRWCAVLDIFGDTRSCTALVYGGLQLWVASDSNETSKWFAKKLLEDAMPLPDPPEVPDDQIDVQFSYITPMGPSTFQRRISAPSWAEICRNYPDGVQGKLNRLVQGGPKGRPGKVAVLHGPPGTGKTTFLRSLTRAWKKDANLTYIIDTEQFFNDPGYMMGIISQQRGSTNVILCEDAEEFLKTDAKHDVGQALSRLLNLGDGMLGQGMDLLLLFTTNTKGVELNPAIIRDGRCFFNEELREFRSDEATGWLNGNGVSDHQVRSYTLGEMYALIQQEHA